MQGNDYGAARVISIVGQTQDLYRVTFVNRRLSSPALWGILPKDMSKTSGKPAMRPKHVPQRTCVVCRETDSKRALMRVVRTADSGVQLDPTGKKNGRGAYLCHQQDCWQRALDSDVLDKALRTTLTAEDRQRLRAMLTELSGQQA